MKGQTGIELNFLLTFSINENIEKRKINILLYLSISLSFWVIYFYF